MRYCFYSGYKDLKGGYTTLLLTLIKELYNLNAEIVLISFEDGLIANELKREKISIEILDFQKKGWETISDNINSEDLLITSKFHEPFYHLMKSNPRIIYYDINDFICSISSYKFKINFKQFGRKIISKLISANSLIFMDDTGVENLTAGFNYKIEHPKFLPIPIQILKKNNPFLEKSKYNTCKFNCTYIGRAVNWKMQPLKKILTDLNQLMIPIKFTLIVDNKNQLNRFIRFTEIKETNLEIEILENITPSEIDNILLEKSDLNFGMGTTALHSAALGIPTVLIDYSENEFPQNYKYDWLYNTKNFSLGKNIEKRNTNGKLTMTEVLNAAMGKEREIISKKCFHYAITNHDSRKIALQLLEFGNHTTFRLKDSKRLIPYFFNAHQFLKRLAFKF